jgi:hypothetical protein
MRGCIRLPMCEYKEFLKTLSKKCRIKRQDTFGNCEPWRELRQYTYWNRLWLSILTEYIRRDNVVTQLRMKTEMCISTIPVFRQFLNSVELLLAVAAAQKWLKDRKDRKLDLRHSALSENHRSPHPN